MFIYQTKSLTGSRSSNEDELDILVNHDGEDSSKSSINYYAVYDGHGGPNVSKYIKSRLRKYFTLKQCNFNAEKGKRCNSVIEYIYELLQEKLASSLPSSKSSGSTALSIIQYAKNGIFNQLKIINLGDCRAVLCKGNNLAVQLTKDHKPMEWDEYSRITSMGGKIEIASYNIARINGLSVSRALGDLDCKPHVSHIPEMFDYELEVINGVFKDKFLILGCDGLWDVMSTQEAVNFVLFKLSEISHLESCNNSGKNNIALMLGKAAIDKGSEDNISIAIIFFRN